MLRVYTYCVCACVCVYFTASGCVCFHHPTPVIITTLITQGNCGQTNHAKEKRPREKKEEEEFWHLKTGKWRGQFERGLERMFLSPGSLNQSINRSHLSLAFGVSGPRWCSSDTPYLHTWSNHADENVDHLISSAQVAPEWELHPNYALVLTVHIETQYEC